MEPEQTYRGGGLKLTCVQGLGAVGLDTVAHEVELCDGSIIRQPRRDDDSAGDSDRKWQTVKICLHRYGRCLLAPMDAPMVPPEAHRCLTEIDKERQDDGEESRCKQQ